MHQIPSPGWTRAAAAGVAQPPSDSPFGIAVPIGGVSVPLWGIWLALMALGFVVTLVLSRFGGWRRLVDAYPAAPRSGRGRRFWVSALRIGKGLIQNATWMEADEEHLHVRALAPLGLLRPPFSVPWLDITATPEVMGWTAQRVVRLTLAREPATPVRITPALFDRIAAASGGRLALEDGPGAPRAGGAVMVGRG